MELLKAFLLGLLEGLTEFIPVSSTGHLIVAAGFLNFTGPQWKVFTIFIQLGAICAVCFAFKEKLLTVARGIGKNRESNQFIYLLFFAFLPSALIGITFYGFIKGVLFSPITVSIALIIGGIVIIFVEKRDLNPRIVRIEEMSWHDALRVGFAQTLAMCPGVSRSGATIIGGMLFGLSRETATQFSFFLAIPTMVAATGYDFYKNWDLMGSADFSVFVVGFTASFFAALLTVKLFLSFVSRNNFTYFGWYRIGAGSLLLFAWQFGWFDGNPLWHS